MPAKKLTKLKFIGKEDKLNEDILLQYTKIYQSNQRQGTVKTKTRAETRGGGAKPYKQKGTGRARAGSIRSPIWMGGGVIHGPKQRDWTRNISKKMRKSAFKNALMMNLEKGSVMEDDVSSLFKKISTKEANKYMKENKIEGRLLLIIKDSNDIVYKSFRNIKYVEVKSARDVSVYDLLLAKTILFDSGVVDYYEERYI